MYSHFDQKLTFFKDRIQDQYLILREEKIMAFQKILVALDCSTLEAATVFQEALKLAKTERSQLMLFHCISWENEETINPLVGIGALGNINLYKTLQKFCQESWTEEVDKVRHSLQAYRDQAISQGVSVEYKYQVGNPSASICEQAEHWGADLVMIGRRTRFKWSELFSRRVSSYVLNNASCSVFMIQTGMPCPEKLSVPNAQAIFN